MTVEVSNNYPHRRLGVIDLGTNTFHLLIVDIKDLESWRIVYRERIFVKLALGGIEKISNAAQKRAMEAIHKFNIELKNYNPEKTRVIATAAFRRAENGQLLKEKIFNETGLEIEIIDGLKEAILISRGVIQALPQTALPCLIMDVGGGSVEFILLDSKGELINHASFPIGVAILYNKFHITEPIGQDSILQMDEFLANTLKEIKSWLAELDEVNLSGASGTFEVLDSLLGDRKEGSHYALLDMEGFWPIHEKVINSDLDQRLADDIIPNTRAYLIVVAIHLIHFIAKMHTFKNVYVSDFAMKEGILSEMIRNLD